MAGSNAHTWALVLAAGAGRRLASVTGGTPKQFWSLDGSPTLLDDTLDRMGALAPSTRTVVVVDRTHAAHVAASARLARLDHVLYQPGDRGTAAGVLFGLSHVAAEDPDALVVMTPSDHGVADPAAFARGLRGALRDVAAHREPIVLFGVEPDRAEGDYGWIVPDAPRTAAARSQRVRAFVEKPAAAHARALLDAGGVWNTMVLVARVSALLDLYERHLPSVSAVFADARAYAGRERDARLGEAYRTLPAADFSHDLLEIAGGLRVRTWPRSVGWSDLGTPERLARWHAALDEPGNSSRGSEISRTGLGPDRDSRVTAIWHPICSLP